MTAKPTQPEPAPKKRRSIDDRIAELQAKRDLQNRESDARLIAATLLADVKAKRWAGGRELLQRLDHELAELEKAAANG